MNEGLGANTDRAYDVISTCWSKPSFVDGEVDYVVALLI